MQYQEAMDYIASLQQFGSVLGLARISCLLELLGNPQNDLRVIHIAGTNGKGSVGTFIASILQASDYQVGRYISPAVYDYRERIQINGQYIPEAALCRHLETLRTACSQMVQAGGEHPTVFELETALCFLYFQEAQCDFVVLEVGLGGRFDSTNVISKPLVSVITSISLDHTDILGDTLAKIAYEKAGILKEGCPAVLYPQAPSAMQVLRAVADELHVSLHMADFAQLFSLSDSLQGQCFDYKTLHALEIALLGQHQLRNAATAIETIWVLSQLGYSISDAAIRQGLSDAKWPGRFEVIAQSPLVVVDGAHNPDAAQQLADTIARNFEKNQVVLVMGVFADKAYPQIVEIMSKVADTFITLAPQHVRALPSETLCALGRTQFPSVFDAKTASLALQTALQLVPADGVILAFGSLSTVGEITAIVRAT